MRERGITAVAVGLLHADVDGSHERAVADALRAAIPDVEVSLSSEIDPQYREYERFSTTVVNAALAPIVQAYLDRVARGVRAAGVQAPIFVMRSDGGMAALKSASNRPATLIESGPASGVIAAAYVGRALGIANVLSFDMGGTTAKAGTVFGGVPEISASFEAAGSTHSGRSVKGSGYPGALSVRRPRRGQRRRRHDRVDRRAPARCASGRCPRAPIPGPRATATATGPPSPMRTSCCGARIRARCSAARFRSTPSARAPRSRPSRRPSAATSSAPPPGSSRSSTPRWRRCCASCRSSAATIRATSRCSRSAAAGRCTRARSRRTSASRASIVPPMPGVFSAYGLLAADVRVTAVRSLVAPADADTWARARKLFDALAREGDVALGEQGVAKADRSFVRELDLRYVGQSTELVVAAPRSLDEAVEAFHQRHEQRYGYAARHDPVEIVTARVIGIGTTPKPRLIAAAAPARRAPEQRALRERRDVFDGTAFADTPVFDRALLRPGDAFDGPAVVEQYDATTYVAPAWSARVDGFGNLVLEHAR